jgi:hypothetical protein
MFPYSSYFMGTKLHHILSYQSLSNS